MKVVPVRPKSRDPTSASEIQHVEMKNNSATDFAVPDFTREDFVDLAGLKMHYTDDGPKDGQVILLLHGVPSWSYIYRKMIPPLAEYGFRVIAPDLIGFGKSDKPGMVEMHSYQNHLDWMTGFIKTLDLRRIILFGQDWGAIIGMHTAVELPERFDGMILSNGSVLKGTEKLPLVLRAWILLARYSPWLPVGRIINYGCIRTLSKEDKRAYDAPFTNRNDRAGIRGLPAQIPTREDHPAAHIGQIAWEKLENYHNPVLSLFSLNDPFTRGGDQLIREQIPGAQGQNHRKLPGGHFIQEDANEELVKQIIKFSKNLRPQ